MKEVLIIVIVVFIIVLIMQFFMLLQIITSLIQSLKNSKIENKTLKKELANSRSDLRDQEIDHSVAVVIAQELTRMRRKINAIRESEDKPNKSFRILLRSLEKLEDSINAQGYEVIDYEGSEYRDGMKLIANFIPSDKLRLGEKIITRTIKPQLNFNNALVRSAEVEVSIGE